MTAQEALQDLLGRAERGEPIDPAALVRDLDWAGLAKIETRARAELDALPVPIHSRVDGPAPRRRRVLEHVLAAIQARRGDPDALLEMARQVWLSGGDHATYLKLLVEHGRAPQAITIASALLDKPECRDREELEKILTDAARVPEHWTEAVREFLGAPSPDAWERLMRFTPDDVYYQRVRHTLKLMIQLGADPNVAFEYATRDGMTPEAIELAERGLVEPRTIVERSRRASVEARGLWLGLAARAACARGDKFGTVRLLREAFDIAVPPFLPDMDLTYVREHGDEELHELLDRAGLPREPAQPSD